MHKHLPGVVTSNSEGLHSNATCSLRISREATTSSVHSGRRSSQRFESDFLRIAYSRKQRPSGLLARRTCANPYNAVYLCAVRRDCATIKDHLSADAIAALPLHCIASIQRVVRGAPHCRNIFSDMKVGLTGNGIVVVYNDIEVAIIEEY